MALAELKPVSTHYFSLNIII